MSFNWLFAILVGATFIFLAIYAANSLIGSERQVLDTQAAQQLESLLNPLETSIETLAKPRDLIFPAESRILVGCDEDPEYSSSTLQVQISSALGQKWENNGYENKLYSKYIFASKENQGKRFASIVLPFNLPYKIGQFTIIWSEPKCLVNPTQEIAKAFGNTTYNIIIKENAASCPVKSERICFESSDEVCDVTVDSANRRVRKGSKNLFYEGNLIYAAIFSDPEIYECNLRRLNQKRIYLSQLMAAKSQLIETTSLTGCSRTIQSSLISYSKINYNNSRNLAYLFDEANKLEKQNDPLQCELWKEEIQ